MIELLALWEEGWLEPRTEAFMWRQMCHAFKVDRCMAVPQRLPARTSILQFDSAEEAIATSECEMVYLMPENTIRGVNLEQFVHPKNACYVFGRAGDSNKRHVKDGEHVVTVYTPEAVDFFAMNVAAIVLYDRMKKERAA